MAKKPETTDTRTRAQMLQMGQTPAPVEAPPPADTPVEETTPADEPEA